MIKWLFFDLGSTLIDERDCEIFRFKDLLKQSNTLKGTLKQRIEAYVSQNKSPYKEILKQFNLKPMDWPIHLEKLYDGVIPVLEKLSKKYHLGIIANQELGLEERLKKYGIRTYFELVICSKEVGISKPELGIFEIALKRSNCIPEEAYMIGDRLDNDIAPATFLGMHTIWIRQGIFLNSNLERVDFKPEIIVYSIQDILKYL